MSQFHRRDDAIEDHAVAQPRAQAEEQHAPALIAAERLHRSVVDDPHRLAESACEVEPQPALPEVHRLLGDSAIVDRARIADGDAVKGAICEFES